MIERLLKSTANGSSKEQSNSRQTVKRPREETSPIESKTAINSVAESNSNANSTKNGMEKSAAVKTEPVTPSVKKNEANLSELPHDDIDDMDFSMLDDEENQFSQHTTDTTHETKETNGINESNIKAKQIKAELLKKENENYAKLLSNWENDFADENDDDDDLLGSIDVEAAQNTITSSADGKSSMKFWYWDAYEDPVKLPGKIFLFGKMASDKNPKEFKSVCVTIENVNRCLYLLPRKYVGLSSFFFHFIKFIDYQITKLIFDFFYWIIEKQVIDPITKQPTNKEVDFNDLYEEFNNYFPHDFKCRKVTKHFAFNVPGVKVPQTCEYLQVKLLLIHKIDECSVIRSVWNQNSKKSQTFNCFQIIDILLVVSHQTL